MKYGYGWVLKFVLAAILLGMGIYMVFADEVVYLITGVVIVIFSLFRVIPLMKTLKKEILRTINLIEIIFDTLIGGVLIYVAATGQMDNSDLWKEVYRYALAFFFYARGLVYLNSVVFLGEKTEIPKFWVHILAITLGTYIATAPKFSYETVGLFLLIVALIGSVYLGFDGFGGYKKYRQFQLELNQGKEKEKQVEKKKEVILDEQKEDRPYVN
ncbi:hypothetical protein N7603_06140 [Acholeplasma vituli]|uniref:Uncharacterized protein n=1 Tax=Paracholeplasma vituli TaxID=69473 RepID=A0ABT2PZZ5_9MOLU|nr:hypothetical protein [Paracholeplasma vituli]MCU0105233.1 hypothetical protein [Paracholeplasma vituli]